MKKTLTILLILCVATALFASKGFSVNAGGAFDLFNLKTDKSDGDEYYDTFKGNGLGFDIGVQYDFSSKIMAYADFNMVFPSDFEITRTYDAATLSTTFKELIETDEMEAKLTNGTASHYAFLLDASIGVAYKFDFNPIEIAVGGGAYINLLKAKTGFKGTVIVIEEERLFSFLTVGVSALVEAKYIINDNIAVRLAVLPQLGIFSKRDIDVYHNGTRVDAESGSLSGVGISFTMPVAIGASYSF